MFKPMLEVLVFELALVLMFEPMYLLEEKHEFVLICELMFEPVGTDACTGV